MSHKIGGTMERENSGIYLDFFYVPGIQKTRRPRLLKRSLREISVNKAYVITSATSPKYT